MLLVYIHEISAYVGESVAFISNSFVFYYLMTEKQRELQEYRNLLLLNCFVDYFCLSIQVLNQPVGSNFSLF
jgi:hypothetical protein